MNFIRAVILILLSTSANLLGSAQPTKTQLIAESFDRGLLNPKDVTALIEGYEEGEPDPKITQYNVKLTKNFYENVLAKVKSLRARYPTLSQIEDRVIPSSRMEVMESPKRFLQLLETDAQDILEYIEEPAPYKDNAYLEQAVSVYYSPPWNEKTLKDLETIEKFFKAPKAYIASQQPQSEEMKEAHAKLAKVRAEIQTTYNELLALQQKYKGHYAYRRNPTGAAIVPLEPYRGRMYWGKLQTMVHHAQREASGITPDSVEKINALISTLHTHNNEYRQGIQLWEQGLLAEPAPE